LRPGVTVPSRISQGLEDWTGLRALWLEGNGFSEIEGLDNQVDLRCLYLHQVGKPRRLRAARAPTLTLVSPPRKHSQNCLKRIDNLDQCQKLATLQISSNMIQARPAAQPCGRVFPAQTHHCHSVRSRWRT